MDAMGKEIILVETVGVGQDEVEIVNTAHTSIVVLVPGMGDDIQAIKAGIIEIGDLFVINKSDREGAEKLERDLRMVLEMGKKRGDHWNPLIFKTEALLGKGISELVKGIYQHKQALEHSDALKEKMRERAKATFLGILESEVMSQLLRKIERDGKWKTILNDLATRQVDPYSLVEEIMAHELVKDNDH
jgi:LAO/AO transport system kinase